jgi:hypothetical protein
MSLRDTLFVWGGQTVTYLQASVGCTFRMHVLGFCLTQLAVLLGLSLLRIPDIGFGQPQIRSYCIS